MQIFNRASLKGFFQKGQVPTEVHFSNMIDSTVNKIDDGFAKTSEHGLKLAPVGKSKKLISLFEDIKEQEPLWDLSVNPHESEKGLSISENTGEHRLFLQSGGNVGIGTPQPKHLLDIEGTVGMKYRVGTYQDKQEVAADAEWHTLLSTEPGCKAFEVVCKVNREQSRGKYAMAHAIAVCAERKGKINVTQAFYGWFWHRLKFRWKFTAEDTRLEVRTSSHYGVDKEHKTVQIRYHVTSLWDEVIG